MQTSISVIQVPGGGDKELERGGKQGEYGDVDDEDLEQANKGQQDANKKRVAQQGGKKATTSLPGKTEQGREKSGVADDNRSNQVGKFTVAAGYTLRHVYAMNVMLALVNLCRSGFACRAQEKCTIWQLLWKVSQ